jgi:hypothetical protein
MQQRQATEVPRQLFHNGLQPNLLHPFTWMSIKERMPLMSTGIHRVARSLPTMQKAVLNAVLKTGMHNEVHGARHIALDNRYQCPELAFVL